MNIDSLYNVRLMNDLDIQEVKKIHEILFPVRYSNEVIKSFVKDQFVSILLTEKTENGCERIIGVSTTECSIDSICPLSIGCYLCTFGIHPDKQGTKLGTDLLRITTYVLYKRFGCKRLTLDVQVVNKVANSFYEHFGFDFVQNKVGYYDFEGPDADSNFLEYTMNDESVSLNFSNHIEIDDELKNYFKPLSHMNLLNLLIKKNQINICIAFGIGFSMVLFKIAFK